MKKAFASALCLLLLSCVCYAQEASYEWLRWPDAPETFYLYQRVDGKRKQVGAFDGARDLYRPLLDFEAGIWGDGCEPPFRLPLDYASKHKVSKNAVPNFGLYLDREPRRTVAGEEAGGDHYVLNTPWGSRQLSAEEARKIASEGLPNDRSKFRLTIIGDDSDRARVQKDLEAREFDPLRTNVNLWSVPPDHWSLYSNVTGKPMFVTTGKPTIYLQGPLGNDKPLHRKDVYTGPEDLRALTQLVKPAAPTPSPAPQAANGFEPPAVVRDNENNYDPSLDPDATKSSLPIDLVPIGMLGVGALGLGGTAAYARWKKRI